MRRVPRPPAAAVLVQLCALLAASGALAAGNFFPSPHLESFAIPTNCDVVISPSNAATTLRQLDDPARRIFCVQPGDYRAYGEIRMFSSGTASARRYLRFNATGDATAMERSGSAIFERMQLLGSWWVVQGLTFTPLDPVTKNYFAIRGGDHNVFDGNHLDGSLHDNLADANGVDVAGIQGNPANYNSIQRNLVHSGSQSLRSNDYTGIVIREGYLSGENNSYNKVLDNEIFDWGDGISVGGHRSDCQEAGQQHGTIVDGNDVYMTNRKRANCDTGALDPNGLCSCVENGIDVKAEPGPNVRASEWTQITNNRVWGYRPTARVPCGSSGANGQAITGGNSCPGHVVVANNVIQDSTIGMTVVGRDWVVAGNVIAGVHASPIGGVGNTYGIQTATQGIDFDIQFNTIVDTDNAYDDRSTYTDTRCNVVVGDRALNGGGWPTGYNHYTRYNFLYGSQRGSFLGDTNQMYSAASASGDEEFCYWRRRWTVPQLVCIDRAATTSASPHSNPPAECNEGLLAPWGIGLTDFERPDLKRCGFGAELAPALWALHRLRRRRSRARR